MIQFVEKQHTDKQVYSLLHPLLGAWFKWKFKTFTEPQKYAIPRIHFKENTLVSAETGTGKTLSAFTSILNELITLDDKGKLEDRVYCIYVSPLKALANDVNKNLLNPLEEIKKAAKKIKKKINVRVGVRTGDTSTAERSKMARKPPHIFITTPESLAIVLNSPKFKEYFKETQWLIIDEIHALVENKRGSHLSLTMERLQRLSPNITRIGLSATVAPLEEIAKYLVGFEKSKPRNCGIVDVSFLKKMDLKVLSPLPDFIHVTPQQVHEKLYEVLDELIQKHRTTLVFTNTRAATERVVHHLKEKYPKNYTSNIGAHHSSLSKDHRFDIENRLKEGKLKVVVSSTSLELGIDIGFIDLVILVGSPKSVARCIQRVGRAGHQLHDVIKGRIIVLDRDDLVECAVLLKSAEEKKIDTLHLPLNAADVLAQQVYGMAIAEVMHEKEMYELVKQSYSFHTIEWSVFNEVIRYLSGEYTSLEQRHVYAKIWRDEETGMVGKRGKLARVIYMTNIGTIPDEARVKVKMGEHLLGSIDEPFAERLKKDDVFVLGGQSYVFKYSRGMTIQVRSGDKRPPTVPSWSSEMLPLSFDLAQNIGRFRSLMQEKFELKKSPKEIQAFIEHYLPVDKNAVKALYAYFREQYLFADIPSNKKITIEYVKQEDTTHAIVQSLNGRRVNDALSRAVAYAVYRLTRKDVEIALNDNGFILSAPGKELPIKEAFALVKAKDMRWMLQQALAKSELLARRFRHCATRSLMILRSYKGRTKTVGRQQMSSRLLLYAVQRIDEHFVILEEAKREILEDAMDIENALKIIQGIEEKKIKITEKQLNAPSPFAFNVFTQGYADVMKMEGKLAFLQRMHAKVMQKIGEQKS